MRRRCRQGQKGSKEISGPVEIPELRTVISAHAHFLWKALVCLIRLPDSYPTANADPFPIYQYDVTADYAALTWINAHIVGASIIVEAANDPGSYTIYGRVSSFTGLPTIVKYPFI